MLTGKHRRLLIRTDADLEAAGALAVARLGAVEHIAIDARGWPAADAARFAAGAVLRAWRFRRFLTRPDPERPVLDRIDVLVDDPAAARSAWAALAPGVEGALYARDLVVEPGNALTPALFARHLRGLTAHGIEIEVIDGARLAAEGLRGVIAVGQASRPGRRCRPRGGGLRSTGTGICVRGRPTKPARAAAPQVSGRRALRGPGAGSSSDPGTTLKVGRAPFEADRPSGAPAQPQSARTTSPASAVRAFTPACATPPPPTGASRRPGAPAPSPHASVPALGPAPRRRARRT